MPEFEPRRLLVTGGAGFIGGNFIRHMLAAHPGVRIVNLDLLTYAGNLASLADVEAAHGPRGDNRYHFLQGDIADFARVTGMLADHDIDTVVHFAAESHVDRSILGPEPFVATNVLGTFRLLEACRQAWGDRRDVRFHHVSTDEVYGSLGAEGAFTEETPYDPSSPYSASKAASDHLARAWHRTYGLPVTVTNCSNNYGPYQFPEKLIPLVILNCLEGKPLPVYGRGENVRDWLHVEDHCRAVDRVLRAGRVGATYNVGGEGETPNLRIVEMICDRVDTLGLAPSGVASCRDLITFVADRPGHDFRYAIDFRRIRRELGWAPAVSLSEGLGRTVDWYVAHRDWCAGVRSGEYRRYYEEQYGNRGIQTGDR
jgi:dTDP-glucose 4,6-dehydratase